MAELNVRADQADPSFGSLSPAVSRRSSCSSTSSCSPVVPAAAQSGPSNSGLTLSIFTPGLTLGRRLALVSAALVVNLGLPFVNGVMLGLGEIFARTFVAPRLGFLAQALALTPQPSLLPPSNVRRRGVQPASEKEAAAADAYTAQETAMRKVAASQARA